MVSEEDQLIRLTTGICISYFCQVCALICYYVIAYTYSDGSDMSVIVLLWVCWRIGWEGMPVIGGLAEMQTHPCDKSAVQCNCCPGTRVFSQKINTAAVLVLLENTTYALRISHTGKGWSFLQWELSSVQEACCTMHVWVLWIYS